MTSKMENTKRQVLPNGLWIVATPIGNLEDFTLRARTALERADAILCEDTRRTSTLLSALQISQGLGRLHRFDLHTERRKLHYWIDFLKEGKSVALVSDAGTPSVSDPGAVLVEQAHHEGISVIPIPGASAVMALLSASGFQSQTFIFRGFFPRKNGEQEKELESLSSMPFASICLWFESPHRIVHSLEVVAKKFPDLRVVVGKELTKVHEKIDSGTSVEVFEKVKKQIEDLGELGEWCFAIEFPEQEIKPNSDWIKALNCMIQAQVSPTTAAKLVSQEFGIPKNLVYEAALTVSGKKKTKGG